MKFMCITQKFKIWFCRNYVHYRNDLCIQSHKTIMIQLQIKRNSLKSIWYDYLALNVMKFIHSTWALHRKLCFKNEFILPKLLMYRFIHKRIMIPYGEKRKICWNLFWHSCHALNLLKFIYITWMFKACICIYIFRKWYTLT